MNIKHNKKKTEHVDPLITFVAKSKEFVGKNVNILVGVAIGLVFIGGLVVGYSFMRKSSLNKAQEAFGEAMIAYNAQNEPKAMEMFQIIVDNYKNTPQGIRSAFMLGSLNMEKQNYDEAIIWFGKAVSSKKGAGFVGAQALESIGICYEAKGDTKSALDYYERALKDDRLKHRHSAIRWKMALLIKSDNKTRAQALCNEILSDTLAIDYQKNAANLLAYLSTSSVSE